MIALVVVIDWFREIFAEIMYFQVTDGACLLVYGDLEYSRILRSCHQDPFPLYTYCVPPSLRAPHRGFLFAMTIGLLALNMYTKGFHRLTRRVGT